MLALCCTGGSGCRLRLAVQNHGRAKSIQNRAKMANLISVDGNNDLLQTLVDVKGKKQKGVNKC